MRKTVDDKMFQNNEKIARLEARIERLKECNKQLNRAAVETSAQRMVELPYEGASLVTSEASQGLPIDEIGEAIEDTSAVPLNMEGLGITERWVSKNYYGLLTLEEFAIQMRLMMYASLMVEGLCLALIAITNHQALFESDFFSFALNTNGGIALYFLASGWFLRKVDKARELLKVQEKSIEWKGTLKSMLKGRMVKAPLKSNKD